MSVINEQTALESAGAAKPTKATGVLPKAEDVEVGDGKVARTVPVHNTMRAEGVRVAGATDGATPGSSKVDINLPMGKSDGSGAASMPPRFGDADDTRIKKVLEMLGQKAPLTEDEQKAQERKKKREAIFAAIGDGISALAGMFAGANVYNPEKGQLAAHKSRWDALEQQQKENQQAYANAYLKLYGEDYNDQWKRYLQGKTEDKEAAAQALAEDKAEREQAKQDREDKKAELYNEWMQGRIEEQTYKTAIAAINAGDQHALNEALKGQRNRSGTGKSSSGGSGGGRGSVRHLYLPDGTVETYTNSEDYKAAVAYYSDKYGVEQTESKTTTSTHTDGRGRTSKGTNTTTVKRSTASKAADLRGKGAGGGQQSGGKSSLEAKAWGKKW